MKFFKRPQLSIRTILISVFLLLMIFPMIVITVVTYHKQNQIFQDQVSQYLLQTIQQTHRALDANLGEIDRMTWPLVYRQSLGFMNGQEVYLNYFRGRMHEIHSVYFITPDHKVLSSDNKLKSFEEINEKHFAEIIQAVKQQPQKLHWFSAEKAIYQPDEGFQTTTFASITAARSILDSNKAELQGYLFIRFNNLFLADVLKNVNIGKTGKLILLDPAGNVVYNQDPALLQNDEMMKSIKRFSQGTNGTLTVNGKWLIAYDKSEISGWRMAAIVPLSELLQPNQNMLRKLLAMVVLGAVVSIFVSVSIAIVISEPVVRLARLMKKASSGDLNVRDTQGAVKEITLLQHNFNRMMETIQRLIRENEQEHAEKREAVMRALQTQIQPHFLYNTLDTMYWMAKKHKAEQISQVIVALGKFFRLSLKGNEESTTLEKEFEHVKSYLDIQSVRYHDKVLFELHYDQEIRYAEIIPLVLQPIVENALEHGITQLPPSGLKCKITITAQAVDDVVEILVADTGKGMDQATLQRVTENLQRRIGSEHIGLSNIHQRIIMAYGNKNRFGLTITSDAGLGTTVAMRIPLRLEVS